jgi:ParB family chromosome partitioning protein
MGHARALLSISNESEQLKAFEAIKINQLSVREVEQWGKPSNKPKSPAPKSTPKSAVVRSIENQLKAKLGLKVQVNQDAQGKGKITLSFNSMEQLNMLLETLGNS